MGYGMLPTCPALNLRTESSTASSSTLSAVDPLAAAFSRIDFFTRSNTSGTHAMIVGCSRVQSPYSEEQRQRDYIHSKLQLCLFRDFYAIQDNDHG